MLPVVFEVVLDKIVTFVDITVDVNEGVVVLKLNGVMNETLYGVLALRVR